MGYRQVRYPLSFRKYFQKYFQNWSRRFFVLAVTATLSRRTDQSGKPAVKFPSLKF